HRGGNGSRLPEECATTLIVRYLNLGHDPTIRRFSAEVFRCDTRRGVRTTEIAEIIKMVHRRLGDNGEVLKWTHRAITALHNQTYWNYDKVSGELSLEQILQKGIEEGRYQDERARESLKRLVRESAENKESFTELAFLTECWYRTQDPDAEKFVQFALDHLYNDQVEFWKEVDHCKEARNWMTVTGLCSRANKQARDRRIKVLFIESDNPVTIRASRLKEAGGADVTIQRRSTGNVCVSIDAHRGINLSNFTRMIRWLELPKDKNGMPFEEIPWEELDTEGEIKEVPEWYFFKPGQQLFNGSLSRPDVQPSKLHDKAIMEVAQHAFHPRTVNVWMKVRGISVPQRTEPIQTVGDALQEATAKQPAPEATPAADPTSETPAPDAQASVAEKPKKKASVKKRKLSKPVSLDEAKDALETAQPAS
ncbi:MAG: hypothetical protein Q7R88_02105, partial [bacterium]|nr:hypothetical protein [bacterium]